MGKEYSQRARRALIATIKKHPSLWYAYGENLEADDDWDVVHKSLNGWTMWRNKQEIRKKWIRMVKYYIEIIYDKKVKKDRTAPQWAFFHDMSFLYDYAVDVISKRSKTKVQKFIRQDQIDYSCPCCLPLQSTSTKSKLNTEPEESSEKGDGKTTDEIQRTDTKATDRTKTKEKQEQKQQQPQQPQQQTNSNPVDSNRKAISGIRVKNFAISPEANVSLPSVPAHLILPSFDIKDDFKFEDIDKLKDYDREVLFFSDTGADDVILIDDD